ncbi:MAG: hypothetical protein D6710_01925 [Nitrospirae bacterium]|nr:MAG: hypothetical protein D6710_01925 [Nitrospirota bacterium]
MATQQYFKFYLPENHPRDLTSTVGGDISSVELKPRLDDLFFPMSSDPNTDMYQYRKFFIKQVEPGAFTNVYLELDNVEHADQVSVALEIVPGDDATNALTVPGGYSSASFTGNSTTPLFVTSASDIGLYFGFWVRQKIPAGAGDDPLSSFFMRVRATKTG